MYEKTLRIPATIEVIDDQTISDYASSKWWATIYKMHQLGLLYTCTTVQNPIHIHLSNRIHIKFNADCT